MTVVSLMYRFVTSLSFYFYLLWSHYPQT